MRNNLVADLSERFIEYQYFRNERAYHAAVKRLAEIHHCLPQLEREERAIWTERLRKETITDEIIESVKAGIADDAQRISQILAYGTVWNADEILLVLTIRIQIDLAVAFLDEHASFQITAATENIDEEIIRISRTKNNQRSYDIATNLMKKNWGLPIMSRWLEMTLDQ